MHKASSERRFVQKAWSKGQAIQQRRMYKRCCARRSMCETHRRSGATKKDAQPILGKEDCAEGTEQRSNDSAKTDAQTLLCKEEYVRDTEQKGEAVQQ
mmetsp:Transcript_8070/g.13372  ORF Transcript_8070/g.13372 Transcript_8070/m.13372 type:complete len:98 (+) Transcript_8070:303-596(+)